MKDQNKMFCFQKSFFFTSIIFSISSALVSATCVDSPLYAITENGERERNCGWIKNKSPTDMCEDANFASHCPLSCGKCQAYRCVDSEAPFVHRNREKSCEWLRGLNSDRLEWICSSGRIRRTCRKTCGFCQSSHRGGYGTNANGHGNHIISFDEVEIFDYIDYSNDYIITDYTAAFRGQYFKDYLGFDAITISNSTAGGNRFDDKPAVFTCPQGTFDMYSMYLAPLFGDGGGNTTTVEISAFDKDFENVGTMEVDLVDTIDVEATRISLPTTFKDLRVVVVWGGFGNYYGFNNIELYIKSECGNYYSDDASSDAMSALLNKYTSASMESNRDTIDDNAWENLAMMADDAALFE